MRALVVYESMYGNTHTVAEHIGVGLAAADEVEVVPVGGATLERLRAADLVVVGGPTHAHGMSTSRSRHHKVSEETLTREADKGHDLEVDPDAEGPGLRDWFAAMGERPPTFAAAFDTRGDGPSALTGRASRGITHKLHHHGFTVIAHPESFRVDKDTHLVTGEAERAEEWGRSLLDALARRAREARARGASTDAGDAGLGATLASGGRYDPL